MIRKSFVVLALALIPGFLGFSGVWPLISNPARLVFFVLLGVGGVMLLRALRAAKPM